MENLRFIDIIKNHAKSDPEKICISNFDESEYLSYDDLDKMADNLAMALIANGCEPGDRVGIGLGNSVDFFIALLGCIRARCIAVPIELQLCARELDQIVSHASLSTFIRDQHKEKSIFSELKEINTEFIDINDAIKTGALLRKNKSAYLSTVYLDDVALLLYTSGTTGQPKAAMHSIRALCDKALAINKHFAFSKEDNFLCMLPTSFGHGLICNCLPIFLAGGRLVIAEPFNLDFTKRLWDTVSKYQISFFSTVPTIVRLIIQRAESSSIPNIPSLRFVTCASSAITEKEINTFEDVFDVPLLNCYGLTETAGWSACTPPTKDRNRNAVGKPINCEFRVVDENNTILSVGQVGELQIRGSSVMLGYYREPELTAQCLHDGWFSTGDLGEKTAEGNIILRARKKDLIIRAGKNIYPTEVERVILTHPEVEEAYTFGLEDPTLGEKVAAIVTRKEHSGLDSSALLDFLRKNIAAYKCPDEIRFVPSVSKNSRGKVNRSTLKNLILEPNI